MASTVEMANRTSLATPVKLTREARMLQTKLKDAESALNTTMKVTALFIIGLALTPLLYKYADQKIAAVYLEGFFDFAIGSIIYTVVKWAEKKDLEDKLYKEINKG